MMIGALSFQGTAAELRRALRKHRMAVGATGAGTMGDENARRQFRRYLRQAEMASLRRQILCRVAVRGGGTA